MPAEKSDFKIGKRYRVRGRGKWVPATLIEDRGHIGWGRRRLLGLLVHAAPDDEYYIELPEEAVKPARGRLPDPD